jgi:eukaryotic-like serine/threonine-protein kinase
VSSATKREGAGNPAADARFDPVPGTIIADKYRVERTLGEGGMGLVVSATHMGLDQKVAIKFLLPDAIRSDVAVERFLREAKVAAKIRSEHVARVHDVGTLAASEGSVPYIVMEHLEGNDLRQLIDRDGALSIDEACEIILQACEGLAQVHAAGIVHRDLKPSNLFVTRKADGSPAVKLLDFGISKLTVAGEGTGDPALTSTATIMGSPAYMSPEQLKSTKEVDGRTDVWSLGAVFYEALTGAPVFRGETLPQVCAMIASEDPIPPSARRADVPEDLERSILRSLDKDPGTRASLVDLARAAARYAPDRAKASLGRIEATASGSDGKGADDLPVLPGRGESRTRTTARRTLEARRGHPVLRSLFLAVVCAVSGVAVYQQWFRGKGQKIINAASSVAASVEAALPVPPSEAPSDSATAAASSSASAPAASAAPSASAPLAKSAPSAAPSKAHAAPHPHHAVKHRPH